MLRFCQALRAKVRDHLTLFSLHFRASNTKVSIKPQLNGHENVVEQEQQSNKFMPSDRYLKFKEKLRSEAPLESLPKGAPHPAHEKEPLQPWPNNTNPFTGEIGGPAGPEPTRYGDWERKGRVTDF